MKHPAFVVSGPVSSPAPASPRTVRDDVGSNWLRPPVGGVLPLCAFLVAILLSMTALGAPAETPPPQRGVAWQQLTAEQQKLLSRFETRWDQLPPERQARLAAGAARWGNLTPEEKAASQQRFQRWQELSPEERQFVRERFRQYQQMNPEERERLRKNFRHFRQLPPEERRKIRERWRNLTPEQRHQLRGEKVPDT